MVPNQWGCVLSVPESLYDQIKERASQGKRSIEDETLDLLAQAVPSTLALPSDLAAAVAPLNLLDDDSRRRAAQSHLHPEAAASLEILHLKRQRQELTVAEEETRDALIGQYERAMLIRARASELLRARALAPANIVPAS